MNYGVRYTAGLVMAFKLLEAAHETRRRSTRFRLRDGRIVEHWAVRDDLRAMIQAGVVTPPGRPTG